MWHMERIGVRELRQNASRYLARVANGEAIEVTDRGRPIARLVPVPSGENALTELLRSGRLKTPESDTDLEASPPKVVDHLTCTHGPQISFVASGVGSFQIIPSCAPLETVADYGLDRLKPAAYTLHRR